MDELFTAYVVAPEKATAGTRWVFVRVEHRLPERMPVPDVWAYLRGLSMDSMDSNLLWPSDSGGGIWLGFELKEAVLAAAETELQSRGLRRITAREAGL